MARLPAAGRTIAVLVAIALAAVATFAIWQYVDNADERAQEEVELVQVFRANAIIPAGTTIEAAQSQGLIDESEELQAQVPVDAVGQLGDLAGFVALTDILPADIIRAERWGPPQDIVGGPGIQIPEDLVAVSVQVGIVEGVAGFINIQDHVSILLTLEVVEETVDAEGNPIEGTDTAATFTQFVLTDVEVLALGQRIRSQTEQGTLDSIQVTNETVLMTLGLTEDQAEQLVFGSNNGTLHVALLPEGFEPQPTQGRTFQNIFS